MRQAAGAKADQRINAILPFGACYHTARDSAAIAAIQDRENRPVLSSAGATRSGSHEANGRREISWPRMQTQDTDVS